MSDRLAHRPSQRLIAPAACVLLSLPVAAPAQDLTSSDSLAALIANLDTVLAAGVTPEATAAILGSSLGPLGPDRNATLLADADQGAYRLSAITITGASFGTPRIGFDVNGPCITSQDAAPVFPAAQWAPYPDRDPARFSQLVETRVDATIRLTFRIRDGCLAAMSMEKAPLR